MLFFLTEKRDGRIKGRKCAVGSKQGTFEGYNKADGISPTVSTDGLLITATINGDKQRDVTLMDIPVVFLQAENDEFILMLLWGKLAEMNGTSQSRTLSKIHYQKFTGTADAICQATEGYVQITARCASFLQEAS